MFYISCFALLSCFHCFDLHFWDCMPDFDTYFYSPFLWDYVPYLYISTIYISLRLFAVFVYFPGSHFFEIFCRICIFLWFTFLWDCLPYLYISLVYISLRLFAVFVYFSGLHFFEIVCRIWIFLPQRQTNAGQYVTRGRQCTSLPAKNCTEENKSTKA